MSTKDGGPAFPRLTRDSFAPEFTGMTLRDYFAASAMQGFLSGRKQVRGMSLQELFESYADYSYMVADEMLKAKAL